MKIGIVLSKTPGYSETFFMSKIKGLQLDGHSVTLFTQSKSKEFNLCKVKTAYPIFKRNPLKQLVWFVIVFFKLLFYLRPVLKFFLLERIQDGNFIFIFKKLYNNAHILTEQLDWLHFGFATMALGKENVATSIGAKMAISLRGFDMAIYPIKYPKCYDLLWQKVDKVHTISNDLLELAYTDGMHENTPFQKITPAINTNTFSTDVVASVNNERKQFITIARLHWKKGLVTTIKAFKILKDKGFEFDYTIVGEGEEFEMLTYIIHTLKLTDCVKLVGKKSHAEIKELLVENEYYVQYSMSEGFCNAVLEAQAMGLLCIVSDAEGLSENVLHEKSGWVVPKRDSKKLAKTILQVSSLSEEEKKGVKIFAMNRVQTSFNLEKQQQEFLQFYEVEHAI